MKEMHDKKIEKITSPFVTTTIDGNERTVYRIKDHGYGYGYEINFNVKEFTDKINELIDAVNELMDIHILTADAVPVVRCKDCKHQRERNTEEQVYLIDGVLICTSPDATDECWNPVFPNHFCSYGERRERE